MKTIKATITILLFLGFFASTSHGETIKFGLLPYDSPTKLYKDFLPLKEYLTKKTGFDIEIVLAPNYTRQIKNIGEGDVDFALVGPVPYVRLVDKYKTTDTIAKLNFENDLMNYVVIIAGEKKDIQSVSDLKGKSFAFGDYQSCGSHFYPRYILEKNGVTLKDLKMYDFISGHSKVILAVEHGDFDGGGVRLDIFNNYKNRGVKVIGGPYRIASHVIVAKKALPEKTKHIFKKALFDLKNHEILEKFENGLSGFVEADDSEFESIRDIINHIEDSN